jgi:acetolactate synthase II small subunit
MKHTLQIQLRATEGAIIRALGTVERRGFRLEKVTVGEAQGDGHNMQLTVSGDRPVALLKRQLERLYDIIWVEIEPTGQSAPDWTHGAGMRPATRRT